MNNSLDYKRVEYIEEYMAENKMELSNVMYVSESKKNINRVKESKVCEFIQV